MKTIAAISTAPGLGGIGIVRISGEKTFDIILEVFKNSKYKKKEDIVPNTIIYGHILREGDIIDEVLVSFFKGPNSYTKEDLVEINTHGGNVVMHEILKLIVEKGAKLAEPGEFTKRAFLNGRIDLTKVESIASILNAKSEMELKVSNTLLKGKLHDHIVDMKNKLLNVLMHIEVNIDYPEYDTDEKSLEEVVDVLKETKKQMDMFASHFDVGSKIMDGIKVAIIGRPNAGKSSLLNLLLNKERAIVTEIEGTTRDSLEEIMNIDGLPIKIIDTAGIRETEEVVEKIGIQRAIEIAKESDLIISLFDVSREIDENDKKIIELISNKKSLIILNKVDMVKEVIVPKEIQEIFETYKNHENIELVKTSLINKEGIEEVINWISKNSQELKEIKSNDIIIIHERQKNIIKEVIEKVEEAIDASNYLPVDMIGEYITQIVDNLNELTGENVKEEILAEIFKNFCLGK